MSTSEEVQQDMIVESADTGQEATDGAPTARNEEAAEGGEVKLVPVGEAKRYRKRAQAAETIAADLQKALAEKTSKLDEQAQAIRELEQERAIDEALIEAHAVDLETARLLTGMALGEMDEPDVERAVAELRERKPFLFRRVARGTGALSPRDVTAAPASERLSRAAEEACASGQRQDVLRYLRLRRRR